MGGRVHSLLTLLHHRRHCLETKLVDAHFQVRLIDERLEVRLFVELERTLVHEHGVKLLQVQSAVPGVCDEVFGLV